MFQKTGEKRLSGSKEASEASLSALQQLLPNSIFSWTMNKIKIIECPRDAMQGWPHLIPTEKKIEYINSLLQVGFDTIDFGSFVSPKAIPQMADTREVLKGLKLEKIFI